jgi:hypothetical protein
MSDSLTAKEAATIWAVLREIPSDVLGEAMGVFCERHGLMMTDFSDTFVTAIEKLAGTVRAGVDPRALFTVIEGGKPRRDQ